MSHRLDNKGVVARVESGVGGIDMDVVQDPMRYLQLNDPDIMAELEAQMSRMPGRVELLWHRGHPEKRMPDRAHWSEHDHFNWDVDAIATTFTDKTEGIREELWSFPHEPEFMVEMHGKKIFGKLRKKLLDGMMVNRLKQYIMDYKVNKEYAALEVRRKESGLVRAGKVK